MIDLAGAERPDKTGSERPNCLEVFIKMMKDGMDKINVGDQGTIINYELSALQTQFVQFSDATKAGKTIKVPEMATPPIQIYFSYNMNQPSCLLSMIICLSQAPQNGWETWFSLQYGTSFSNLQTKIAKVTQQPLKQSLTTAGKALVEADKKADPSLPKTKNSQLY